MQLYVIMSPGENPLKVYVWMEFLFLKLKTDAGYIIILFNVFVVTMQSLFVKSVIKSVSKSVIKSLIKLFYILNCLHI